MIPPPGKYAIVLAVRPNIVPQNTLVVKEIHSQDTPSDGGVYVYDPRSGPSPVS